MSRTIGVFLLVMVACDAAGPMQPAPAEPGAEPGISPSPVRFERITVDAAAAGAAYVTVVDLDGDGRLDLVTSLFGTVTGFPPVVPDGRVRLYRRSGSLADWTMSEIVPASDHLVFPNATTVADVDGDGDLDVIVPAGFLICPVFNAGDCGSLDWYEQNGGAWTKHSLVSKSLLFYHGVAHVDFDGDGLPDLITTGEARVIGQPDRVELQLFRGTHGADRFERLPVALASAAGSFPLVRDLDGDGDLDVASAEFFVPGAAFAWLERTGPRTLSRHVISDDCGPSVKMTFVDGMFGDGRLIALGANHANTRKDPPDEVPSAIYAFVPDGDLRQPWRKAAISDGIVSEARSPSGGPAGAPGIFGTGDIDGDGDLDVLVAGDGDPRVYWLEQVRPARFATHVLEERLTQAGGMVVADLDGDGRNELVVTGYDDSVIYIYRRVQ